MGEGNGLRPVVHARAGTRRPAGLRVPEWMVIVFGFDPASSRNYRFSALSFVRFVISRSGFAFGGGSHRGAASLAPLGAGVEEVVCFALWVEIQRVSLRFCDQQGGSQRRGGLRACDCFLVFIRSLRLSRAVARLSHQWPLGSQSCSWSPWMSLTPWTSRGVPGRVQLCRVWAR
jgi:hypothetical protein